MRKSTKIPRRDCMENTTFDLTISPDGQWGQGGYLYKNSVNNEVNMVCSENDKYFAVTGLWAA